MKNYKEEIIKKIVLIDKDQNIISVYRVGIVDNSLLSDVDLVLVVKNKKRTNNLIQKAFSEFDIRFIFTENEFVKNCQYLPYEHLELIYGKDIKYENPKLDKSTINLIKLSSLFFISFLRNFYFLKKKKNINFREVLIYLNDFTYAQIWCDFIPKEISEFIEKIKFFRMNSEKIESTFSKNELFKILDEAIDYSWKLIDILNEKLKKLFIIKYPKYFFTGKEPTIFVPASVNNCCRLTEKNLKIFSRTKILYLPLGFQYIFNDDEFVSKYVKFNLKFYNYSLFGLVKILIKKIIDYFFYLKFLFFDIYKIFSSYEAYSGQSFETYISKYELFPSEKKVFEELKLPLDAKILDVGCGGGRTTFSLINSGYKNIIGIDFNEDLINDAKKKFDGKYEKNFRVLDIVFALNMYSVETFDEVFFSYNGLDYLYPLEQRKKVLNIINDLLKKNGYFIFSSHNLLCVSKAYLKTYFKNIPNLLLGRKYLVADQSFGKVLTYFSTPYSIIRELNLYGFRLIKIIPSNSFLFPFRDSFPYFIFQKNKKE